MRSSTPISDIMSTSVISFDVNDSLLEVERTFGNHNLRHAPVLEEGQLVGMLSLLDIRRKLGPEGDDTHPRISAKVGELMTQDPIHVQVSASVSEVAAIFIEDNFHAIPVLEGDRVVGIVSTTDIIRFLLEIVKEMEEKQ